MLAVPGSIEQIESPASLRTQKREWAFERIGWGICALILVAAVLGLLGPGPLSDRTATSKDGTVHVEYSAFERYEAPSELRIRVQPKTLQNNTVRLAISRSFADETTIDNIAPEPLATEMQGDKLIFVFQVTEIDDDWLVVCRYTHDTYGSLSYEVGLDGGDSVSISQFIYP